MTKTIEIGGHSYGIGRLDVFKQLDLARRVMPVYQKLLPKALARMVELTAQAHKDAPEAQEAGQVIAARVMDEYVILAAAELSDEDFHFVTDLCLSACERIKPGGVSYGIVKPRGGVLAFQDIQPTEVLALVFQTLAENLGSFFPRAEQP